MPALRSHPARGLPLQALRRPDFACGPVSGPQCFPPPSEFLVPATRDFPRCRHVRSVAPRRAHRIPGGHARGASVGRPPSDRKAHPRTVSAGRRPLLWAARGPRLLRTCPSSGRCRCARAWGRGRNGRNSLGHGVGATPGARVASVLARGDGCLRERALQWRHSSPRRSLARQPHGLRALPGGSLCMVDLVARSSPRAGSRFLSPSSSAQFDSGVGVANAFAGGARSGSGRGATRADPAAEAE